MLNLITSTLSATNSNGSRTLARAQVAIRGDFHSNLHASTFSKPLLATLTAFMHPDDGHELFELVIGRLRLVLNDCVDVQPKPLSLISTAALEVHTLLLQFKDSKVMSLQFMNDEDFHDWQSVLSAVLADLLCLSALRPDESGQIALVSLTKSLSICSLLTAYDSAIMIRAKAVCQAKQRLSALMTVLAQDPSAASIAEIHTLLQCQDPLLQADPDMLYLGRVSERGLSPQDWGDAVSKEVTRCADEHELVLGEEYPPMATATIAIDNVISVDTITTLPEVSAQSQAVVQEEPALPSATAAVSEPILVNQPNNQRLRITSFTGRSSNLVHRGFASPPGARQAAKVVTVRGRRINDENAVNRSEPQEPVHHAAVRTLSSHAVRHIELDADAHVQTGPVTSGRTASQDGPNHTPSVLALVKDAGDRQVSSMLDDHEAPSTPSRAVEAPAPVPTPAQPTAAATSAASLLPFPIAYISPTVSPRRRSTIVSRGSFAQHPMRSLEQGILAIMQAEQEEAAAEAMKAAMITVPEVSIPLDAAIEVKEEVVSASTEPSKDSLPGDVNRQPALIQTEELQIGADGVSEEVQDIIATIVDAVLVEASQVVDRDEEEHLRSSLPLPTTDPASEEDVQEEPEAIASLELISSPAAAVTKEEVDSMEAMLEEVIDEEGNSANIIKHVEQCLSDLVGAVDREEDVAEESEEEELQVAELVSEEEGSPQTVADVMSEERCDLKPLCMESERASSTLPATEVVPEASATAVQSVSPAAAMVDSVEALVEDAVDEEADIAITIQVVQECLSDVVDIVDRQEVVDCAQDEVAELVSEDDSSAAEEAHEQSSPTVIEIPEAGSESELSSMAPAVYLRSEVIQEMPVTAATRVSQLASEPEAAVPPGTSHSSRRQLWWIALPLLLAIMLTANRSTQSAPSVVITTPLSIGVQQELPLFDAPVPDLSADPMPQPIAQLPSEEWVEVETTTEPAAAVVQRARPASNFQQALQGHRNLGGRLAELLRAPVRTVLKIIRKPVMFVVNLFHGIGRRRGG